MFTVENGQITRLRLFQERGRGPRSRRAFGVGDVAGERGDRAGRLRGVQSRRLGRGASRLCDPDFELRGRVHGQPRASPRAKRLERVWRMGLRGRRRLRFERDEFVDSGEKVVAVDQASGAAREGSGAEVENRLRHVWTLRDGKVVSLHLFRSRDRGPRSRRAFGVGDVAGERGVGQIGVEAYNAGPEAYLAFMAEDIEVRPDASVFPEGKPFRGRDEFRRFLAELDEGWEAGDKSGVIREVFAVGDRVVAPNRLGTVGAGPAASTSAPVCLPSSTSGMARSFGSSSTSTTRRPSKPRGCAE